MLSHRRRKPQHSAVRFRNIAMAGRVWGSAQWIRLSEHLPTDAGLLQEGVPMLPILLWMATETEKRRMSQAMAVACDSVGGQAALARAIGRPEETVSDWVNGKSVVDPELVVEIERITGMSRHELRPDLSR